MYQKVFVDLSNEVQTMKLFTSNSLFLQSVIDQLIYRFELALKFITLDYETNVDQLPSDLSSYYNDFQMRIKEPKSCYGAQ